MAIQPDTTNTDDIASGQECVDLPDIPGVFPKLGALPPSTPVTEDGLAQLLGKSCRETIKRAVARGELPPPVRLMGKNTWTVGAIIQHLEDRLKDTARRFSRMRP